MAFKSDQHRKWWFANRDNLPTNEGTSLEMPTKVGFSKEERNRLQNEENLILELQNMRSKNR